MTTICYKGYAANVFEIRKDGRVIAEMLPAKLCAIDGDLSEMVSRAMARVGDHIIVPNRTFARGVSPRNYAVRF